MLGWLLANPNSMRIIRNTDSWSVLSPALGGKACCLERLAVRFGYRVGELCAELRCSERYFRTVFLRDIGLPPKEWMRQERMVVARRLLDGGRSPLAVSESLGFASLNNFRREFLATYGDSPVGYVRSAKGGEARILESRPKIQDAKMQEKASSGS